MKRIILVSGAFLALASVLIAPSSLSAADKAPWTGSAEQKLFGLMTVWSEAKFNFPFFDRIPSVDWDAKVREFIPRVLAADSLESYYDRLMEFAALLNDGHTAVIPPWPLERPGFDHPPVELQVIGDRFCVARVGDSDDIIHQNIYPGLEVLEIAGTPVRAYFEDHSLRFRRWGTKQADDAFGLMDILSGPKDVPVVVKVKDADGGIREVTLARKAAGKNGRPFLCRILENSEASQPLESKEIEPGICYVRLLNFGEDTVAEQFRKVLEGLDLGRLKGLILDVRYNPGGNTTPGYDIISRLIDRPLRGAGWKSINYIPAYRSWGNPRQWLESEPGTIDPAEGRRYAGPVVVLTGPATFSSAEDFLVPLKFSGRAVLVGETSAGSTGNPIRVSLPGGGAFKVVSKRDLFPDGREWVGLGIAPDVEVHPTQRALLEGTDPVLQKGIEVIKNWSSYYR
jgi:carboxyl-terminal processing protease